MRMSPKLSLVSCGACLRCPGPRAIGVALAAGGTCSGSGSESICTAVRLTDHFGTGSRNSTT